MKPGKLTIEHQIAIPKDVRIALGPRAGDQAVFAPVDGRAVISKPDGDEPGAEEWTRLTRTTMPEWFDRGEDAYWADL
jgi:bifunctional DNA-binding transcriptional regulator/antitoxin component of YhaV-PrlF toxin-antitoxin module